MDVYSTSSSTPVVGSQGATATSTSTSSSPSPGTSSGSGMGTESDFSGYQDQLGGVGTSQQDRGGATPGSSWTTNNNNNEQSSMSGGSQGQWPLSQLGSSFFDLKSLLGRQPSQSSQSGNNRARERSILAPDSKLSSNGALATKPGSVATPVVPSSTTTAAPEYVMINPTRTSSENSDQDD